MTSALIRVTAPTGDLTEIAEDERLVFGRGPDADLVISADRGSPAAPG